MCHPSQKNQTLINELSKKVEVWQRKAQREKLARKKSEVLLEEYSREIYHSNKVLKETLEFSKKRQSELAFLGQVSEEISTQTGVVNTLKQVMVLIAKFYHSLSAFLCLPNNTIEIWQPQQTWRQNRKLEEQYLTYIQIDEITEFDHWIVTPIEALQRSDDTTYWLVYSKISIGAQQQAWCGFMIASQRIDAETLNVLDTAKRYINNGIKRQLNKQALQQQNLQLKTSIDELEAAKVKLIQSEKMASLGELAAGVAHEINNPIGYIRANLNILNEYLEDFAKLHTQMQKILQAQETLSSSEYQSLAQKFDLSYLLEDSAQIVASNIDGTIRVSEIIEGLRNFSHEGRIEFGNIFLPDCIDKALKIAGPSLKYKHVVDLALSAELPDILGNAAHLQQVFVNLFVNAAHAMPNGGMLSIFSQQTTKTLSIHVKDTGCGMDEHTRSQIFIPFYTTKKVGEGTGLGLSVSYGIMESHNAEIKVLSELGQGCEFILTFPLPEQTEVQ